MLGAAAALLVSAPSPAAAADCVVSPSAGDPGIQAAINSGACPVVTLEAGYYAPLEPITVPALTSVKLQGAGAGMQGTAMFGFGQLQQPIITLNEQGSSLTISDIIFQASGANAIVADPTGLFPASLTLERVNVGGGRTAGFGGGVRTGAGVSLTVRDSGFGNNHAGSGGGAIAAAGIVLIERSTFGRNMAGNQNSFGNGGAIALTASTANATVINTTFSQNTAYGSGGAIDASAGTPRLDIRSSTLSENRAGMLPGSPGDGGAIAGGAPGNTSILNSILYFNFDYSGPGTNVAEDCSGEVQRFGWELIGDPGGCTLTGTAEGFKVGNPAFKQDSPGGSIYPLLEGSPALNSGSPAPPGSGGTSCPATDQRGHPRGGPEGRCDIGAYEGALPRGAPGPRFPVKKARVARKCKKLRGRKRAKCLKRRAKAKRKRPRR
jgi:predicted outer membrane repeat protein